MKSKVALAIVAVMVISALSAGFASATPEANTSRENVANPVPPGPPVPWNSTEIWLPTITAPFHDTASDDIDIHNHEGFDIASGNVTILYNSSVAVFAEFREGDFDSYDIFELVTSGIPYDRGISITFSASEGINETHIDIGDLVFRGELDGGYTQLVATNAGLYDEDGNSIQVDSVWNGSVEVARAMVKFENVTVHVNNTAKTNITIRDFGRNDQIAGGTVELYWYGDNFNMTGVLEGDYEEPVANINNTAGEATITASRATAVEKNESVLAKPVIKGLRETWWPDGVYIDEWDSSLVNESGKEISPVLWEDGWVEVEPPICPGDANANGEYDAGDVVLIKQIIVGIKSRDEVPGDPDANQDGEVTVQDAIKVQRWIVGLEEPPCEIVTKEKAAVMPTQITGSVVQVESETLSTDETGNVSITVTDVKQNSIAGAQIELHYDPSIAVVNKVYKGDFGEPIANINNSDGWVSLTASRATAPDKSNATIANLEFEGVEKGSTNLTIDEDFSMVSDENASEVNVTWLEGSLNVTTEVVPVFDTGPGTYPSVSGMHNGTVTPSVTIEVSKLYTYPCPGTGGHSEYVKIWNDTWSTEASWNGYKGDWHNITFPESFTLKSGKTYNYTIKTGSYPQIIHRKDFNVTGGKITCTEFTDVNGKKHDDWIPAIKLY